MLEAKIARGKDGQLRLENFYTPLAEAKQEIWRRWNDKELRKKVDDFLGDIPSKMKKQPHATLVRHLNTPDQEYFLFLKMANKAGLDFASFDFTHDKFSSKNSDKYYLGRLFFDEGKGRNGGSKINSLKILNFNACDGKPINKINTIWNENFVDFHHRILNFAVPEAAKKNCDLSDWLEKHGKNPNNFYIKYLSLFLRNGILFEDFITEKSEAKFSQEVVVPCFNELREIFGVKPLIVQLRPRKKHSKYWWCYPFNIKKFIQCMYIVH